MAIYLKMMASTDTLMLAPSDNGTENETDA
jgi:hypothetical protein